MVALFVTFFTLLAAFQLAYSQDDFIAETNNETGTVDPGVQPIVVDGNRNQGKSKFSLAAYIVVGVIAGMILVAVIIGVVIVYRVDKSKKNILTVESVHEDEEFGFNNSQKDEFADGCATPSSSPMAFDGQEKKPISLKTNSPKTYLIINTSKSQKTPNAKKSLSISKKSIKRTKGKINRPRK